MKEFKGAPAVHAGRHPQPQAVEHYEIARYGTLEALVGADGPQRGEHVCSTPTLNEEKKTDGALTQLAETMVNEQAEAAE